MKSLCVVVLKNDGEKARKELAALDVIRNDLIIKKDEKRLYIPINDPLKIKENRKDYKIVERTFQKRKKRVRSYKELINLPSKIRNSLPSSFDIVGDIAILKLKNELYEHKREIGDAILKAHKNVHTVLMDKGVEGCCRLRDVDVIAGERKTKTVHKEYALEFKLDIAEVYFSPRLATERRIVTQQVKDNETIIDMFCGVGPFSIMIAKYKNPKKIYAIDFNPSAIEYLEENIEKNKVKNVVSIQGDAKEVLPTIEKADRIIMNLPLSSIDFFEVALKAIDIRKAGIIHYYEILEEDELEERIQELNYIANKLNCSMKILARRMVRTYSPRQKHFALDLNISKKTHS